MTWLRAALAFVGLLPWVRGLAAVSLGAPLRRAIDQAFEALCHHAPARTLELHGALMTICSRCAGVYLGLFLAAVWPWRVGPRWLRPTFFTGAACMAVDIVSQDLGLHGPSHPARLATGALFGFSAAAWMLGELRSPPEPSHGGAHGQGEGGAS